MIEEFFLIKSPEKLKHLSASDLTSYLRRMFSTAVKEANQGQTDEAMRAVTETFSDNNRFCVRNARRALSVRSKKERIDVYLMNTADLALVPASEYQSRLKFSLEYGCDSDGWLLDGNSISNSVLRLAVLSATNDLFRKSDNLVSAGANVRLAVGDVSLSAAVREVLSDRQRLSQMLLNLQETTFERVAMDIHDGVVGDLMVLCRELDAGNALDKNQLKADLMVVVQHLRDVCNELSSRELRDWGLKNSLAEMCQRMSGNIEVSFQPDGELPKLPGEANLHIYRIAQECLNNALKYSKASLVEVKTSYNGKEFVLQVSDDGVGFMQALAGAGHTAKGGIGFAILQERTKMLTALDLPARLSVRSAESQGCTIELHIDTGMIRKTSLS